MPDCSVLLAHDVPHNFDQTVPYQPVCVFVCSQDEAERRAALLKQAHEQELQHLSTQLEDAQQKTAEAKAKLEACVLDC